MIDKILKKYDIKGEVVSSERYGSGNINKTYVVVIRDEMQDKKYLIQQINNKVFTEPYKLMKNIDGVTSYLKKQMELEGDTKHKVLELIKTKDNKNLCYIVNESDTREYYRIYEYIDNAISYDTSKDREVVFNTGKAFGNFQRLLKDYPIDNLEETIKDFHDTGKRYNRLMEDIEIDSAGRVEEVSKEIEFIKNRAGICNLLMTALRNGKIPYRVTHNDTKVNNVMMDKDTNDYLAVIDLDTVMPGSMLFDYGDGVRSTCAAAGEHETDLSKVYIDQELFKAYTDGYLSEMASSLNRLEVLLMVESIRIMTLELAIRFLNDYINGDTYFRVDYEKHNLDRARNQIKLVQDIEEHLEDMKKYIFESYERYI